MTINNCPFCNSSDVGLKDRVEIIMTTWHYWRVVCINCGSNGPVITGNTKHTKEIAIKRWNNLPIIDNIIKKVRMDTLTEILHTFGGDLAGYITNELRKLNNE